MRARPETAEVPNALRAAVEKEAQVFRDCGNAQYACVLVTILTLTASAVAFGFDAPNLAEFLFKLYLVFTAASIAGMNWLTARAERAVVEMTRHARLNTIGVLVDLMENTPRPTRQLASELLVTLLPRLRATNSALLNDHRRAILNRLLNRRNARHAQPLVLAILRAWEQIGDEQAIAPVERLARSKGYFAAPHQIREAAEACLPALRDHAERDRLSNTLLRSATDPGTPDDTLLRPASSHPASEPALLLRATNQEEAE